MNYCKIWNQVYDEALENDVLQYLRKSEITINSYEPKKTKKIFCSIWTFYY